MKLNNLLLLVFVFSLFSCTDKASDSKQSESTQTMEEASNINSNKLSEEATKVGGYLQKDLVIAHRGSTYFAPEETEPAFRWARNIGADYLEFDIQLTKDKVLVAFHDNTLKRTTDVATIFPKRIDHEINTFTLLELRSLDAGAWFNELNPDRASPNFVGQHIMTLEDVTKIAEGYRIKRKDGKPVKNLIDNHWDGHFVYEKDTNDNGNRPGIYIETKNPKPNVEKLLSKELSRLGWNINEKPKEIVVDKTKVSIANTNGRLILQSFEPKSIIALESFLPNIPKCFLLWQPEMKEDIKGNYQKAIQFSLAHNVHGIGPSIAGAPNNYGELTAPWMVKMIHDAGLQIHPYTFDTDLQLKAYKGQIEGVFTNRADLALKFYNRLGDVSSTEVLKQLGY